MKSTFELQSWSKMAHYWDWERISREPARGIPASSPGRDNLIMAMRDLIDKPGHDIHSVVPLIHLKGMEIKRHQHPEHTVIYYVDPGDPAVAIVVDKGRYPPQAGETLILGPNEWHAVERSQSCKPRLALALRVVV